MEYLSKQRHDEIASELNHLINVVYPKVKESLAETSAQEDRSENAGYRKARRIKAKTISRIRFLQKILDHSRVITPDALPKDSVCLLSRVEFTNLTTNTRMKFEIVSPHEMNLEAGKISLKSPIGAALMGKKQGEIAEAQTPSGTLRLRIESITFDWMTVMQVLFSEVVNILDEDILFVPGNHNKQKTGLISYFQVTVS